MGRILDQYGKEIPPRPRRFDWWNASKRAKALFVSLLGAVAALAILLANISTIQNFLFPNSPKLRVAFFESNADTLNLYPSVNTAVEYTESIPLHLKLENTGGSSAKNVKVYLSYYSGVVITAQYSKEEKRTWNSPNDAMKQVTLDIPDMNPGESFLVPISIQLPFPKDFQRAIRAPKESVLDKDLLVPKAYPIYCDVSSDSSPSTRTILHVVLGNLEVFREQNKHVYWLGHGDDGIKVLEVKDDFPTR
ncbi:MAG: hypothetical protein ABW250_05550 [Pyrinomonadaceae bacterium]